MRQVMTALGLSILAVGFAGPAQARTLPPKSLVCGKELSIRQAAAADVKPDDEKPHMRRDCYFTRKLLNVTRLSCEKDICKISVALPGGEPYEAYTLRRYEP